MKSFLLVTFILFGFIHNINATVYTDNVAGATVAKGNWSTPTTWLPVGVPTSNDTVMIMSDTIIVDISSIVVKKLMIMGGSIKMLNKLTTDFLIFSTGLTYGRDSLIVNNNADFSGGAKKSGNPFVLRHLTGLTSLWSGGIWNLGADPDDGGEESEQHAVSISAEQSRCQPACMAQLRCQWSAI